MAEGLQFSLLLMRNETGQLSEKMTDYQLITEGDRETFSQSFEQAFTQTTAPFSLTSASRQEIAATVNAAINAEPVIDVPVVDVVTTDTEADVEADNLLGLIIQSARTDTQLNEADIAAVTSDDALALDGLSAENAIAAENSYPSVKIASVTVVLTTEQAFSETESDIESVVQSDNIEQDNGRDQQVDGSTVIAPIVTTEADDSGEIQLNAETAAKDSVIAAPPQTATSPFINAQPQTSYSDADEQTSLSDSDKQTANNFARTQAAVKVATDLKETSVQADKTAEKTEISLSAINETQDDIAILLSQQRTEADKVKNTSQIQQQSRENNTALKASAQQVQSANGVSEKNATDNLADTNTAVSDNKNTLSAVAAQPAVAQSAGAGIQTAQENIKRQSKSEVSAMKAEAENASSEQSTEQKSAVTEKLSLQNNINSQQKAEPVTTPFHQTANQKTAAVTAPQIQSVSEVKQAEQLKQQLNILQQDSAGQLQQKVNIMLKNNIQVADIRVDPAELGPVRIRVSMQQEQASVQFIVQQAQTRDLLEQQLPRLRDMLQQQGIQLGEGQVQQQQKDQQLAERESRGTLSSVTAEDDSSDEAVILQQQVRVPLTERLVDYYA